MRKTTGIRMTAWWGAAQASDADNENDGVSEPVRQAPVKKAVAFVVGGEDDGVAEPVRQAPVKKAVAFVVGGEDDGNAGREVRKAVAFIAGADDAENDSGAPTVRRERRCHRGVCRI